MLLDSLRHLQCLEEKKSKEWPSSRLLILISSSSCEDVYGDQLGSPHVHIAWGILTRGRGYLTQLACFTQQPNSVKGKILSQLQQKRPRVTRSPCFEDIR